VDGSSDANLETLEVAVGGMRCAGCVASVERELGRLPGVEARVNLASGRAYVRLDPSRARTDQVISAIAGLGFSASLVTPEEPLRARSGPEVRPAILSAALTLPFLVQMLAMLFRGPGGHEDILPLWLQFALATAVQLGIGWRFLARAFNAIRHMSPDMDVLVALGTSAAWAYSSVVFFGGWEHLHIYFEASPMVITMVLIGRALEERAREKTWVALDSLAGLAPRVALVERGGALVEMQANLLIPDDIVVARPGDTIPADGEVIEGRSDVNEAMLTGESMPLPKSPGDKVFAGTLNGEGLLRIRVTGVGASTVLSAIVRLVGQALGSRMEVQRIADRAAAVFVPAVILISMATFGCWLAFVGDFSQALIAAVSVLVVACPCALGLATPTAVVVGMGLAAKRGILVRNARSLELASRLDVLVFDKTGTLTAGRFVVADLEVTQAGFELSQDSVLRLAASLEQASAHPVAVALVDEARRRGLALEAPTAVTVVPGSGVEGVVSGRHVRVGSPRWLGVTTAGEGRTKVAIEVDGQVVGSIQVSDQIRPEAREVVARLRSLGIEVVMLTGDNASVAAEVARAVGVSRFFANILPEEKARSVEALRGSGKVVGMVGDGVNDAPALAAADVSVAMGAGAHVAQVVADMTLMGNDLRGVVDATSLSRATVRKIHQNLFWAFAYNAVGLLAAALGYLSPMLAGAAMAMSSVCVVSNSLLLKRWRPQG